MRHRHPLIQRQVETIHPRILGHEASGEIVEVGRNVSKVSVGDRVAINPIIRCGHRLMCKTGYYNIYLYEQKVCRNRDRRRIC